MNGEQLRAKLEEILQTPVRLEWISVSEWAALVQASTSGGAGRKLEVAERAGELIFDLGQIGGRMRVLSVKSGKLSESERKLLELAIEAHCDARKKPALSKEGEGAFIHDVKNWIEEQAQNGAFEDHDPPEAIAGYPALYAPKVPLLLYGEYTVSGKDDYLEFKKLLTSFFEAEVLLIPLRDKEWLILVPESLLSAGTEEDNGEESYEEALASLCSGLQTMISSEWVGECHVSAYYPIIPAQSLPATVLRMRDAIRIGRLQRVGRHIHLPWQMYLDQLLHLVPAADKQNFIAQVFKRTDPFLDPEMIQTLETFFDLDCNVSETAKRLYIHRNTLLYRLDKFKQETGLDVRSFNQAVHVKLALQLYKVTKRA